MIKFGLSYQISTLYSYKWEKYEGHLIQLICLCAVQLYCSVLCIVHLYSAVCSALCSLVCSTEYSMHWIQSQWYKIRKIVPFQMCTSACMITSKAKIYGFLNIFKGNCSKDACRVMANDATYQNNTFLYFIAFLNYIWYIPYLIFIQWASWNYTVEK